MKNGSLASIAIIATLGLFLAGCKTFGGAKEDVSAAVSFGKAALSYDPTNGAAVTLPPDIFGPVKVYTPVPEK